MCRTPILRSGALIVLNENDVSFSMCSFYMIVMVLVKPVLSVLAAQLIECHNTHRKSPDLIKLIRNNQFGQRDVFLRLLVYVCCGSEFLYKAIEKRGRMQYVATELNP